MSDFVYRIHGYVDVYRLKMGVWQRWAFADCLWYRTGLRPRGRQPILSYDDTWAENEEDE